MLYWPLRGVVLGFKRHEVRQWEHSGKTCDMV